MYELRFDDDAKRVYQTVADDLARRLNLRNGINLHSTPIGNAGLEALAGKGWHLIKIRGWPTTG